MNKFDAISALRPTASYRIEGEKLIWKDVEQTEPTEAEINAKITELQNAEPMRLLRLERDRKLLETDWRASSDLTLSSEWSTYRQALRDLPSTATPTLDDYGNLENVTWPTQPE